MFAPLANCQRQQLLPQRHAPNLQIAVIKRFLNPRRASLLRGSGLVLISLFAALLLSNFPHNRATPTLALPAIFALAGTADTARCMKPRWSFYHGGVLLLIYMDLMALCMIFFFLFYPYMAWMTFSR